MGDDPIIPGISGTSSANGNTIINHYSLTTGQLVILVAVAGLALGISIGVLVQNITSQAALRAQVQSEIARVGDRAGLAERETRIMRDEIDRMKVEQQINTNH